MFGWVVTLSWRRSLSCRNQSIDFLCKKELNAPLEAKKVLVNKYFHVFENVSKIQERFLKNSKLQSAVFL